MRDYTQPITEVYTDEFSGYNVGALLYHSIQQRSPRTAQTGRTMPQSDKRYVYKDGVVVDAEIAERLGVEGGVEFEQWIDPGEVVRRAFSISPERAKAIREEIPLGLRRVKA